jgi:hypothetical protein
MTRNPHAKALASRLYRVRVVKSKKIYQRQPRNQRSTHGTSSIKERYEAR